MSAFDLFKDYGLKVIDDDNFLNVAGLLEDLLSLMNRLLHILICTYDCMVNASEVQQQI